MHETFHELKEVRQPQPHTPALWTLSWPLHFTWTGAVSALRPFLVVLDSHIERTHDVTGFVMSSANAGGEPKPCHRELRLLRRWERKASSVVTSHSSSGASGGWTQQSTFLNLHTVVCASYILRTKISMTQPKCILVSLLSRGKKHTS